MYISNIFQRNISHVNGIRCKSDTYNVKIQYISDIHIDTHTNMPDIRPVSNYLAICGDIGQPYAKNYKLFIKEQSKKFEKVFVVPGNHDFDLGPMYRKDRVDKWEPYIKNICDEFNNVYYLNRGTHHLNNNILIIGSILWSKPMPLPQTIWEKDNRMKQIFIDHMDQHNLHVDWISNTIDQNSDKKILILTHFVPTLKLIEEKYLLKGKYTNSWFATDLEYLIKKPVKAWICGHTHSVQQCKINDVYCAVNALGNGYENNIVTNHSKIVEID